MTAVHLDDSKAGNSAFEKDVVKAAKLAVQRAEKAVQLVDHLDWTVEYSAES